MMYFITHLPFCQRFFEIIFVFFQKECLFIVLTPDFFSHFFCLDAVSMPLSSFQSAFPIFLSIRRAVSHSESALRRSTKT